MRKISCICGSNDLKEIVFNAPQSMRSDGLISEEPLKKLHCNQCGTAIGVNSQPLQKYHRTDGTSLFELQRQQKIAEGICSLLERHKPSENLSILEIGAGNFSTALQVKNIRKELQITAIEPNPECLPKTNKINIILDSFEGWESDEKFEVIYCNHVIEHIENISTFISKALNLLSNNGLLFLFLPCHDPVSNELLFSDHLYHITPDGMAKLCKNLDITLYDSHLSSWDQLSQVFVIKKGSKVLVDYRHSCSPKEIFEKRVAFFENWVINIRRIMSNLSEKDDLIIYGAGEFTQLVRAYGNDLYKKASFIIVDHLNGARKFDKPVFHINEVNIKKHKVLLCVNPASIVSVQSKITKLVENEKHILHFKF